MKQNTLISSVAFAAIFLAAVFLFIRNYPNDRWFSVVFIVAGGRLAWCAEAEAAAEAAAETANPYENTTSITNDTNDNMNKIEGINGVSDNIDETTNLR
jgi:hypothetical protein